MARTILAAVVLLLGPLQAAAGKLECALDGSAAADDALDAALFIYAASQRCKGSVGNSNDKLKCASDVISTVSAVTNMANTIAKAVEYCGKINDEDPECGLAAGDLVGAVTALGAASADITNHCFQAVGDPVPEQFTDMGKCVIDVSQATHGIFDSASSLKTVKESCDDEEDCAMNALNVMSAMANMGSAIAGSLNDCKAAAKKGEDDNADCASNALAYFAALNDVASNAIAVSNTCTVPDSRLYAMRQSIGSKSSSSNLFVTALVAVAAAVMGFAGGLRFKRKRTATTSVEDATDSIDLEPIMGI